MKKKDENLNTALQYDSYGWSVVPIPKGKKSPFIKWKSYKDAKPTNSEIHKWFKNDNSGIGVITGKVSGIFVLDLDVDESGMLPKLPGNVPPTVTVKTGGGGLHYYFKHPGFEVQNSSGYIALKVDIRGDGGLVVAPPSIHENGSCYEWVVDPDDAEVSSAPEWLIEALKKQTNDNKPLNVNTPVPKGERNVTAARVIGKILHSLPVDQWDVEGLQLFQKWNEEKCSSPLSQKELSTVFESIRNRAIHSRQGGDTKIPESKTDKLILLALGREDHEVFHDQYREPFIRVFVNGHYEVMGCETNSFVKYLSSQFYSQFKETVSKTTVLDAAMTISGKAQFEGERKDLSVRCTFECTSEDDSLWYDLVDSDWKVVEITKEGWDVLEDYPILFKRYSHQNTQVTPSKEGDIRLLDKYINISNKQEKLLVMVTIISYFIPGIPRPLLYLQGQQGSAKSTLTKIIRTIIDPSSLGATTFPSRPEELVQILEHNYVNTFDNLSKVSNEMSDYLCRAITGGGMSKRKLYSDNSDIIYNFTRSVVMNGINTTILKPDLLDRSIVVELDVIDKSKRRTEQDIWNQFNTDLPFILGGIFNVLSQSMKAISHIELSDIPRMADYAKWGCAISESLGYGQNKFLEAYYSNIKESISDVSDGDVAAVAIKKLIDEKVLWKGTSTELYEELVRSIDVGFDNYFPRNANALSRHIKTIKPVLSELGYVVEKNDGSRDREWTLRKYGENCGNVGDSNI